MKVYLGGLLLCTNPFAVAIATKLIEDSEGTLFFFTVPLNPAQGFARVVPLVSPWIVYVPLGVAVSALLILFSILILERKRG